MLLCSHHLQVKAILSNSGAIGEFDTAVVVKRVRSQSILGVNLVPVFRFVFEVSFSMSKMCSVVNSHEFSFDGFGCFPYPRRLRRGRPTQCIKEMYISQFYLS